MAGRIEWVLHRRNAAVAVAELVTFLGVGLIARPHLEREFFSTAAAVLPVLLVAVVFEVKGRSRPVGATLVLSFLFGEFVALAIAGNRKTEITSSWWLGAVVAAIVGLSLVIVLSSWSSDRAS